MLITFFPFLRSHAKVECPRNVAFCMQLPRDLNPTIFWGEWLIDCGKSSNKCEDRGTGNVVLVGTVNA